MNALRQTSPILTRAALAIGACALLGGCVADPFGEAKVDPASPVAADVTRATSARSDYPSFKDIPQASKDTRPLVAYGRAARELELAAARIERETAPETWTLQGTEAFAETARKDVGPDLPPVGPTTTEDYVRELRERATPPPRPRR